MPNDEIVLYGTNWCSDCLRARRFFRQHKIDFKLVNIDHDSQAEQFVLEFNKGMRSVPTIVFPDGSILVEPTNDELAEKLGIPR